MKLSSLKHGIWASSLVWVLALPVLAQGLDADWIPAHYTKQEVQIPMRDGVMLFTSIYRPKDETGPHPFLLNRTPYSVAPYGAGAFPSHLGPSDRFTREGFIFVYQDVRGRFMSGGDFVDLRPHKDVKGPKDIDESTDTFDTVAWLLAHVPKNNGKVGQWGISYPGFYTAAGAIDAHPALVAISPQAPCTNWFAGDDFHRNGALWLPHLFNFIYSFGQIRTAPTTEWPGRFEHGTNDGYDFFLKLGPLKNANARHFHGTIPFWNDVMAHGVNDSYWQIRNLHPHMKNIRPAVLVVGGWFDAENLYGSLSLFRTLERQSPQTSLSLAMGPWFHGGWERSPGDALGDARFGSRTSETFMEQVELPFFLHHLKGAPDPKLAKAIVFETGANRWESMEAWPPRSAQAVKVYFQASRALGFERPQAEGADAFVSDPAHPVPFHAGPHIGMPADYMTADQRFVASRPDVLSYQGPVLDRDLEVAGPIRVHLAVSTTGTDADWVVKVIDVQPDGAQRLIRGEVMRGKFRESLETPKPFVPGRVTVVEYALNDIFHAFQKGHRLMVQVQSSWFPLMDRNPQVFTDIYRASENDFRAATHTLWRSKDAPSWLELPVRAAH